MTTRKGVDLMSEDFEQPQESAPPPRRQRKPARFATLARFEGRVTEKQITRLKKLQRELSNGNREAKLADVNTTTERITDNTLIRVALELLFQFEDDLHGHTERELIASMKRAVDDLRSRPEHHQVPEHDHHWG